MVLVHGVFGAGKSFLLTAICVLVDEVATREETREQRREGEDREREEAEWADREEAKAAGGAGGTSCGSDDDDDDGDDDDDDHDGSGASKSSAKRKRKRKRKPAEAASGSGGGGGGGGVGRAERPMLRVMVAAATNVAVDRVLQCLLEQGFDSVARVGSLRKVKGEGGGHSWGTERLFIPSNTH